MNYSNSRLKFVRMEEATHRSRSRQFDLSKCDNGDTHILRIRRVRGMSKRQNFGDNTRIF